MIKSDWLKNQTRESATIVEQCTQLLKSEWMETLYCNILHHKEDVARKLMKSLYNISKLLCEQEYNHEITHIEHQEVADFLKENHRQVFTFFGGGANAEKEVYLKKLYCSENGIDIFPLQFPFPS